MLTLTLIVPVTCDSNCRLTKTSLHMHNRSNLLPFARQQRIAKPLLGLLPVRLTDTPSRDCSAKAVPMKKPLGR